VSDDEITGKVFGVPPEHVGNGEIIREGRTHECDQPRYRTQGTIWRCCDCGRRWFYYQDGFWRRRYWPWPR
jgi:hypothetical protein